MDLKLIADYKDDEGRRHSFNELAHETFGIDFEEWYQSGCWDKSYICHSYFLGDEIVSNVSASLLNLIINNQNYRAVLIGTVMTRPGYRNRGLSNSLMKIVLDKYENDSNLMYLFANKSALNFYPKFGFRPVKEHQFSAIPGPRRPDGNGLRKLNPSDGDDLNLLKRLAAGRRPVSRTFGVIDGQGILMWYCLTIFKDYLYYCPEEDSILIYKIEENILNIYDIISGGDFRIDKIIEIISTACVREIIFYFNPDFKEIKYHVKEFQPDDTLFIKSGSDILPGIFKYPVTAQA